MKGISGKCFDEKNQTVAMNDYSTNPKNIEAVMMLTNQYIK